MSASTLPVPPPAPRERTQLEAFLVLRRNPLELWGPRAYEEEVIPGKFLGRSQLLLNDPEAIRHVLVTNADNYTRTAPTRRVLAPVLGSGLFLAEGAEWRHQRRTIAPAFTPRTMPILARHVVIASERTEAVLDGLCGRPVELLLHLQHLALGIAGQSMFSLEMAGFGQALRALLLRYARDYAKVGLFDLVLSPRRASPLDVGRARFRTEWLALMDRLIDTREAQGREDQPRDLLDMLTAARDPETGDGFDRAQLRDEIATLILAGHETTAVTLFWALFIAARMPAQQEALAHEAGSVDLSTDASGAAIAQLPRIRAHVDEALRLYPPAFLIVREARGPDEIAGHRIAPGTVVSVSPWVLHRHRARWRDPEVFDPERFLPGAPAPARFSYLPFGAGPRICVGAQFALTEAVLVLARLLWRYRVELLGASAMRPRGLVTTQPDRPVRFLLTRRAQAPRAQTLPLAA